MGSGSGSGLVVDLGAVDLGAAELGAGVALAPGGVLPASGLDALGSGGATLLVLAPGAGALPGGPLVQPATSSSAARDRTPTGRLMT